MAQLHQCFGRTVLREVEGVTAETKRFLPAKVKPLGELAALPSRVRTHRVPAKVRRLSISSPSMPLLAEK